MNLIVKNKEEIPGDVVEAKKHSESTNNLHSALYWAAATACDIFCSSILADAEAAAA